MGVSRLDFVCVWVCGCVCVDLNVCVCVCVDLNLCGRVVSGF